MTFLQRLQAHKGGLIRLKTELYWYDGRGYDNTPGRICLILDAAAADLRRTGGDHVGVAITTGDALRAAAAVATAVTTGALRTPLAAVAHLLIDGQPAWIWVAEQDIELLVNDQPIS